MSVTATTIKAMFPQFVLLDNSYILLYINTAEQIICSAVFGNKYDIALSFLTAHFLLLSINQGNSGELKKVKVDTLEREYEVSKNSNRNGNGFGSTSYGQQYLAIKKSLINKVRRPIYGY